jgi:hypothetical protein
MLFESSPEMAVLVFGGYNFGKSWIQFSVPKIGYPKLDIL